MFFYISCFSEHIRLSNRPEVASVEPLYSAEDDESGLLEIRIFVHVISLLVLVFSFELLNQF